MHDASKRKLQSLKQKLKIMNHVVTPKNTLAILVFRRHLPLPVKMKVTFSMDTAWAFGAAAILQS